MAAFVRARPSALAGAGNGFGASSGSPHLLLHRFKYHARPTFDMSGRSGVTPSEREWLRGELREPHFPFPNNIRASYNSALRGLGPYLFKALSQGRPRHSRSTWWRTGARASAATNNPLPSRPCVSGFGGIVFYRESPPRPTAAGCRDGNLLPAATHRDRVGSGSRDPLPSRTEWTKVRPRWKSGCSGAGIRWPEVGENVDR